MGAFAGFLILVAAFLLVAQFYLWAPLLGLVATILLGLFLMVAWRGAFPHGWGRW